VSKLYKAYLFRGKEPVIDELRTMISDANGGEKLSNRQLVKIEREGGPSTAAMRGWFFGKVKRPQSAGVEAAGRALGFKRVWQKVK